MNLALHLHSLLRVGFPRLQNETIYPSEGIAPIRETLSQGKRGWGG